MELRKVIIDCDAGTDDAVALIILIAAHKTKKIKIMAITCVSGNTSVDNVVINVFRTLEACDALDIPVFKGTTSPILDVENAKIAREFKFHGSDGFGDIYKDIPDISKLKRQHAVSALHEITSQNPGEVSVLCLAPLMNIALAIKLFPEFLENVKEFYVMGGNTTALGNTTSQAEFNFYSDPESAHILINNNKKKLWLLPWETCLKSRIEHEWRQNVLGKIETPCIQLLNDIEEGILSDEKKALSFYSPCDALLAAIFLRPDLTTDTVKQHADIELNGSRTRGQVVIDHLLLHCEEPNVHLIQDIDTDIFKDVLLFAADPFRYNLSNGYRTAVR
ncbi:inosine-uridine preferring nucleoside hydrolase [Orussus abietinus]|uniref:inosine-uridine preferring nucleoside hydrolase n=1 Tax=Orussus abietinus TaxID=222816 RepID=UPI0006267D20|nr:inosine-uridine preferring nucleoside hydrolase [Orussus abietinus]XP_023290586.1 inosine-uridine preferring nucleoside hydrolase [Orussus abietinus]